MSEVVDYGLTPEQRNNLMRLAIYLDTLPVDYKEFDMYSYFVGFADDTKGKQEKRYARKNGGVASCGTSACAVGHGPSAGIPVPKRFIEKSGDIGWEIDWHGYSGLFCPYSDRDNLVWSWMFSEDWAPFDNHHYGAAARIKYVLMGEKVRGGFRYPNEDDVKRYANYRRVK